MRILITTALSGVFVAGLCAPSMASTRVEGEVQAAAAARLQAQPLSRPFAGVRFYYVPSQKRYRAVKFAPGGSGGPSGHAAGAYSSGANGASCFTGSKRGSVYVGTLYSIPSGPKYKRTYSTSDLLFGQQTWNVPRWFKREARDYLNGNGVCAVW